MSIRGPRRIRSSDGKSSSEIRSSPTDQSCTVVLCWSIIDYSVARYVALFRLHENVHYLDVHYLSDVVFGAAVGTICGTHGDSARSVKLCDVADCHDSRRRISNSL